MGIDESIPSLKMVTPPLEGEYGSGKKMRDLAGMNVAEKVENLNNLPVDHSNGGDSGSKGRTLAGTEKGKPNPVFHG